MKITSTTQHEIEYRIRLGMQRLTVKEFCERFEQLGYSIDRTSDCRSVAKYLNGDRAGETYIATSTGVNEEGTSRSAFHFESRRDENYRRMQQLRSEIFAVTRDSILEV